MMLMIPAAVEQMRAPAFSSWTGTQGHQQARYPEDRDRPLEVVTKNPQGKFGPCLGRYADEGDGMAHQALHGPDGVLGQLTAELHPHRVAERATMHRFA